MAKKRIAILGSGPAAMSSAFWLSSYPGWKDDWEIDVYQTGWRLGGKCASGRNAEHHQRIEEHGLHIFLGFYDNAFHTMQKVYTELGRGPDQPLATWDQAWKPHSLVVFMEQLKSGRWEPWPVKFPENDALPGTGNTWPTGWDYVKLILDGVARILGEAGVLPELRPDVVDRLVGEVLTTTQIHPGRSGDLRVIDVLTNAAKGFASAVADGVGFLAGLTTIDDQLLFAAKKLAVEVGSAAIADSRHTAVGRMLRRLRDWVWKRAEEVVEDDAALRRAFITVDLAAAMVSGMIEDDLIGADPYFFKLDDLGWRDWMRKHGASELSIHSAPINALYSLPFCEHTEMGAGTGIHCVLRLLFGYKGAIFWEMQAGMGDVMFTPFYEVLKRRGVRFHFFHRVDRLEMSADGKRVAQIHLGRQIGTKGGAPYQPLVDVKGLPCWPSRPLFDQLDGGDDLAASGCDLEDWWTTWTDRLPPRVLTDGVDFDTVILGTAVPSFRHIAPAVLKASPRLRATAEKLVSTQTQALQLWFRPDLRGLGWPGPKPIVGAYALWLDTWADLSHLLPREDWPPGLQPGNLAYLVSRLLDDEPEPLRGEPGHHDYPARQRARVRANLLEWLRTQVRPLWPHAVDSHDPRGLNWYFLVDSLERAGEARLDAQFMRSTVTPSERYVLSEPGTWKYRLRAEETDIDNLLHVGDHTFTAINAGCVEAAFMSGMNAAQVLCGHPQVIVGDVLPRSGPWGER